jgi:transposase-like protein
MRKYDEEFRREAVRKVLDGQSVASVARELGISN